MHNTVKAKQWYWNAETKLLTTKPRHNRIENQPNQEMRSPWVILCYWCCSCWKKSNLVYCWSGVTEAVTHIDPGWSSQTNNIAAASHNTETTSSKSSNRRLNPRTRPRNGIRGGGRCSTGDEVMVVVIAMLSVVREGEGVRDRSGGKRDLLWRPGKGEFLPESVVAKGEDDVRGCWRRQRVFMVDGVIVFCWWLLTARVDWTRGVMWGCEWYQKRGIFWLVWWIRRQCWRRRFCWSGDVCVFGSEWRSEAIFLLGV